MRLGGPRAYLSVVAKKYLHTFPGIEPHRLHGGMKNALFRDVTLYDSCKNQRFGEM
jgi:hypothetical protein